MAAETCRSANASGINVSSTRASGETTRSCAWAQLTKLRAGARGQAVTSVVLLELHFGAREFQLVAAFERDRAGANRHH